MKTSLFNNEISPLTDKTRSGFSNLKFSILKIGFFVSHSTGLWNEKSKFCNSPSIPEKYNSPDGKNFGAFNMLSLPPILTLIEPSFTTKSPARLFR